MASVIQTRTAQQHVNHPTIMPIRKFCQHPAAVAFLTLMLPFAVNAADRELFSDNFNGVSSGQLNANGWYFHGVEALRTDPMPGNAAPDYALRNIAGTRANTHTLKQFDEPITLSEIGDFVSISLKVYASGVAGQQLQIGFFNVGSEITANTNTPTANPITEKNGYVYRHYFTENKATYALTSGTSTSTSLKTDSIAGLDVFTKDVVHNVTFTVSLTAEGLKLATIFDTIPMSSHTFTSLAGQSVTMDTLWLFTGGIPNNSSVYFDDIIVTTNVAAVPEPSTLAMLLGTSAFMLGVVSSYRRRSCMHSTLV